MTADFERVFDQLDEQLKAARHEPVLPGVPEVEGVGTAHDDRITATIGGGRLTGLEIQAVAMRLSNAELAEQVMEAVNAAIDDHTEKLAAELTQQNPDFDALATKTTQLRSESMRAMKLYTESLFDVINQVKRYE